VRQWFRNYKLVTIVSLVLALVFVAACGSTSPAPQRVVEKEVLKEVEVIKEISVEKEVIKEVIKQIVVTPEPQSTAIPMVLVKGQTFNFPIKPAWVRKGKYSNTILDVVIRSNPGAWDVHFGGNLFSSLVPASPQFNQLVEFNPVKTAEIIGDLARSWEVNADGTVYTFRLHDAQWSDGRPVTAEDIVYSFDRITEPGAIRARTKILSSFYEPGTAKALDAKTLEVPLKFPAATFLPNLASDYMKMYPKHIADGMSQDDANRAGNLLGSGPWVLKEFEPNGFVEYLRNPLYFKPDRPFFDGFTFTIVGRNYARAYASLEVGQVSMTEGLSSGYRPENVFALQEKTNGRLRALHLRGTSGAFWILNTEKPPLDDPRLRAALHIGMDRREAVDVLYCQNDYGECFGSVGIFSVGSLAGEAVEPLDQLEDVPGYRVPKERDFVEARALMAEAGFPDGFKLTLNLGNSPTTVKREQVVAEQFKRNLGIEITLDTVDTATNMARLLEGAHDISSNTAAFIVPDIADNLNQHYLKDIVKNPQNWGDPKVDELLTAQEKELNPEKRLAMVKEIVAILRKGESHLIPVVRFDQGGLMDYRIKNYTVPGSIQLVHKLEHIWWDADAKCPSPKGCQQ